MSDRSLPPQMLGREWNNVGRGEIKGQLHGVPVAVKDLCWTTNAPTAAGMTMYSDYIPSEDATVVKRLADAGAVILGKLQLTESAYADHHPKITPPRNPWGADAWPGGISSRNTVVQSPRPLRWTNAPLQPPPSRAHGAVSAVSRSMPKSSWTGMPSARLHSR